MTLQLLLLHPAMRLIRIALSIGLAAYFVLLLWSDGHAGYGTWTSMLCLTAWNSLAERTKLAKAR